MKRIGVYLPDDLDARLKMYTIKKTGKLHGLSDIVRNAIEEYLDRHELEIKT